MNDFETKLSMYVFPSTGDTFADDITAIRAEVYSSQGRSVTLSCNYSIKAQSLQWYRQYPGSAPQFLLLITDTTTPDVVEAKPPIPRLSVQLNQKRNRVDLEISSAEVTDSALYYCAVRPTVTGNTQSLYKNLWRMTGSYRKTRELAALHFTLCSSFIQHVVILLSVTAHSDRKHQSSIQKPLVQKSRMQRQTNTLQ
uniref:Ig-like domain-containing protein n=1 Tax=Myripristis murdjan TaxID=586833 RepID=A0A667WDB5_9TELE